MRARRTLLAGVSAMALALTFAACDSDDGAESTTDTVDQAAEATVSSAGGDDTKTTSDAAQADEDDGAAVTDDVDQTDPTTVSTDTTTSSGAAQTDGDDASDATPCPEVPEEWRDVLAEAAPAGPAPAGLADAVLPIDIDAAGALFGALPDELIGETKAVVPERPGWIEVNYQDPDRASRDGFQALDLRDHMMGSILPEPRADMLVASFVVSDDDDFTVEAAGHDGDLYWVTYIGTNSGYGIDGVEEVYTVTWGQSCSPLAFIAAAPHDSGRTELITAFIETAATVATQQ